ncbi:MAG: DUF115 domain-containing protein [Simkaniaceae bacterium]|nr:DUF115 domain-containing protein [Candidatus Sacchlamyda saccharinae]
MKKEFWQTRYPDISFYLSFFAFEKTLLPASAKELDGWLETIVLSEIEVLYIIGLVDYSLPKILTNWLSEKKERALVFVEEDLGAFAAFNQEALLENPQIHFHYANEDPIEHLAQRFPVDRLAVFEGKPFDGPLLKRRSAALSALYSDVLYSHKIVENVVTNMKRLKGSFDARGKFEGVPAVICGAGPSLEKAIPTLQTLNEKALIFGGGSAITALSKAGVKPHFAIALDPNDEEFDRLRQAEYFEGPFLFAPRLHCDVFYTTNGPFGYLKSDTGGLIEGYLEDELKITGDPVGPDLGSEAFSVTTLAVSYAYAMGCNPIIFAGVDLAYTGGVRYAGGVEAEETPKQDPRALEERILRKDIYGNEVETLLKWVMESDCIANFAKKHADTTFLNCTEGGLGFAGIQNTTLAFALSKTPSTDLSARLHAWIQERPLSYDSEKLAETLFDLQESLIRCSEYTAEILNSLEADKASGKLALLTSDFGDELAYTTLLQGIDIALSHILFRYYPHPDDTKEREIAKYREIKRQIDLFLKLEVASV